MLPGCIIAAFSRTCGNAACNRAFAIMTTEGDVGKVDFDLGARVRLSELGRKNSRYPDKQGTVVGISRTGSAYRVRWADLKTADYVHWSFLQACEELVNSA